MEYLEEYDIPIEEMENGDLLLKIPPNLYNKIQTRLEKKQSTDSVEETFVKGICNLLEKKTNKTTLL